MPWSAQPTVPNPRVSPECPVSLAQPRVSLPREGGDVRSKIAFIIRGVFIIGGRCTYFRGKGLVFFGFWGLGVCHPRTRGSHSPVHMRRLSSPLTQLFFFGPLRTSFFWGRSGLHVSCSHDGISASGAYYGAKGLGFLSFGFVQV